MALALRTRSGTGPIQGEEVMRLATEWQAAEVGRIKGMKVCRDLSIQDIEDLYVDTALALADRCHNSELHLRSALHDGVRKRARRAYRDRERHTRIVERTAPGEHALAEARSLAWGPEDVVFAEEDRFIVAEFLSELSQLEQSVFKLLSDGMAWRAAADALGIDREHGRRLSRACERKRARFALLFTSGRLCGFRAQTIEALKRGDIESAELARQAHAHLRACPRCRIEHGTNGERFRALFERQAAALLPFPALLAGRLGLLARTGMRSARYQQHLADARLAAGPGTIRDQLAALAAGGAAAAKLATGVATVVVVAGGAIGAHVAIDGPAHHPPRHRARAALPHPARSVAVTPPEQTRIASATAEPRTRSGSNVRGRARTAGARRLVSGPGGQHAPAGFAYLGVPRASDAVAASRHVVTPRPAPAAPQRRGGPFSP